MKIAWIFITVAYLSLVAGVLLPLGCCPGSGSEQEESDPFTGVANRAIRQGFRDGVYCVCVPTVSHGIFCTYVYNSLKSGAIQLLGPSRYPLQCAAEARPDDIPHRQKPLQ
jgi:hypothetical protein